jgi:hypothetical protein
MRELMDDILYSEGGTCLQLRKRLPTQIGEVGLPSCD